MVFFGFFWFFFGIFWHLILGLESHPKKTKKKPKKNQRIPKKTKKIQKKPKKTSRYTKIGKLAWFFWFFLVFFCFFGVSTPPASDKWQMAINRLSFGTLTVFRVDDRFQVTRQNVECRQRLKVDHPYGQYKRHLVDT